MNCPYCGKTMKPGFIEQQTVAHSLRWEPHETEYSKIPFIQKDNSIKLTSVKKGGRVSAHHCEECRKFIIDEKEIEI